MQPILVSYEASIELIYIEGSRRQILEAFWKSPYLNVTFCIDLKIGTWPHDFRKRIIIPRAEYHYAVWATLRIYFLLLDYLKVYKNPSVPDLYSITGTLAIWIVSSKGFDPHISVADDVSPLYLLTLLFKLIISSQKHGCSGRPYSLNLRPSV